MNATWSRFNITSIVLGFAFLYLPIVLLIIFSFNESKLVTVWAGFSTKWYVSMLANRGLMDAAWVTIRVGLISASVATVLGTLAALTLTRYARFRGRILFSGMVFAPLVMPEVITGITQLLLFVSMMQLIAWPHRGFTTIVLSHVTFCSAYVTVTVQSRLQTADRSLEEAAMDLGASPARAFLEITLPIIAPAIISSWLLCFTLSLDDLVISSFVAGPGASTLPMVIYSKVKLGVSPDVNALASLIVCAVGLCIVGAGWLMARGDRRRALEAQLAHK
jgi:putrescine transport system permease protein